MPARRVLRTALITLAAMLPLCYIVYYVSPAGVQSRAMLAANLYLHESTLRSDYPTLTFQVVTTPQICITGELLTLGECELLRDRIDHSPAPVPVRYEVYITTGPDYFRNDK